MFIVYGVSLHDRHTHQETPPRMFSTLAQAQAHADLLMSPEKSEARRLIGAGYVIRGFEVEEPGDVVASL